LDEDFVSATPISVLIAVFAWQGISQESVSRFYAAIDDSS
jgi:hypothetical protein